MNRRRFLTLSAGLLVAPAIVRVSSIMPISVPRPMTFIEALAASMSQTKWSLVAARLNNEPIGQIAGMDVYHDPFIPAGEWYIRA